MVFNKIYKHECHIGLQWSSTWLSNGVRTLTIFKVGGDHWIKPNINWSQAYDTNWYKHMFLILVNLWLVEHLNVNKVKGVMINIIIGVMVLSMVIVHFWIIDITC